MQTINISRLLVLGAIMGVFAGAQAQVLSNSGSVSNNGYQLSTGLNRGGIANVTGTPTATAVATPAGNDLLGTMGAGGVGGHNARVFTPEPISMTLMGACSFAGYLRMRRRNKK